MYMIVICLIVFYLYHRFYPLIKAMEELNAFLDIPKVDNAKKREYLKGLIAKGQQIGGKKSWTLEGIDSASNKVIAGLYAKNSSGSAGALRLSRSSGKGAFEKGEKRTLCLGSPG